MTPAIPGPIEPERPATIDRAIQLIWVVVAIDLVSSVLGLLLTPPPDLRDRDAELGLTADELRVFAYVGLVLGMVLVVGLWAWVAIKIRHGRGWARVLGTVFYGFAASGYLGKLLFVITGGESLLTFALSSVTFGISTYILVLIWRPESTQYFNQVKWQQLQASMPRPSY